MTKFPYGRVLDNRGLIVFTIVMIQWHQLFNFQPSERHLHDIFPLSHSCNPCCMFLYSKQVSYLPECMMSPVLIGHVEAHAPPVNIQCTKMDFFNTESNIDPIKTSYFSFSLVFLAVLGWVIIRYWWMVRNKKWMLKGQYWFVLWSFSLNDRAQSGLFALI